MRCAILVFGVAAVAACDMLPGQQAAGPTPGREAAFVALVEQSDCRFNPDNHPEFHEAGFTDPEMRVISGNLVADGQAEVGGDGVLVLTSGACI